MALSVCPELDKNARSHLLQVARHSIESGLLGSSSMLEFDIAKLPDILVKPFGAFVTLTQKGALRGCVGQLEASQPLVQVVANSAVSAAFKDHRFPELKAEEIIRTRIEISVLSTLEPVVATAPHQLLKQLRPGKDGLLLNEGQHSATFLPKVWEQLPDREVFLQQLLLKAGLSPTHWSETIRFQRYQAVCFGERSGGEQGGFET